MAENEKPEEIEPEPKQKIALVSAKGILALSMSVILTLVLCSVLYFAVLVEPDPGVGVESGPEFIEGIEVRATVLNPETQESREVRFKYYLETVPGQMKMVEAEVAAIKPIVQSRVLKMIRGMPIDELAYARAETNIEDKVRDIHNKALREYSLMSSELGESPIQEVLITEYNVR